ncbi:MULTISPECIES: OmpA family protein [unclassified Campylobacter]|uniref:OmpA family protein n=1 Tax=unclassified Campylobacter TaxID=2593542 RepID=UPI0022E997BC|nr:MULTISPECIES: OmpA family protein [unclassified Campylobacter]
MRKRIFISIPLVVALSGCAEFYNNLGKIGGTAGGAAIGAVVGKEVGGDKGLVIGAAVGAGIGFLIGKFIDERRAAQRQIAKEHNAEISFDDIKTAGEKGDRVTIADNNQFGVGKSSLNSDAKILYTKLAKTYQNSQSKRKILIVGHTDDSGASKNNQKLSEARAKTVGQIFAKNGTNIKDIYYWGAGESQPIADNNTNEGRMKNRRVEIIELDKEEDIIKYTQNIAVNPAYFTKIARSNAVIAKSEKQTQSSTKKAVSQTSKTKNETSNDKKPVKIAQKSKQEPKTNTPQVQENTQEDSFEILTKNPQASKSVKAGDVLVDFDGRAIRGDSFALGKEYGGEKSTFSIITKAYASTGLQNCYFDVYHEEGGVKHLSNGKALPKTTEFRKSLNGGSWQGMVNNNLVGIAPISVLRDGGRATANPKVLIFKDYVNSSNAKSDYKIGSLVNTYEGENGLLYRVFSTDKKSPIKCMDIVFDNKNSSNAKGYLYYTASNGAILEKDFEIKPLRK